jgi:hypothetical protein
MALISDFSIACAIVKHVCKVSHTDFIEMPIVFDGDPGVYNDRLCIGKTKKIGETLYNIVSTYLGNFDKITGIPLPVVGERRKQVSLLIFYYLQSLVNNPELAPEASVDEPLALRLYQLVVPWLLMKDIVCPVYDIPVKNVKILTFASALSDTRYVDVKDEIHPGQDEESFIFVNAGIEDQICKNAQIFLAAIEAHGLEKEKTIREILSSKVSENLENALGLVLGSDEKAQDFLMLLSTWSGMKNFSDYFVSKFKQSTSNKRIKEAQLGFGSDPMTGSWWYLGLLEKALSPARGPDWSVHLSLYPYIEDLNLKIEAARRKKGRAGLSMESLLRIKDGEVRKEDIMLLEKILGANRVW